MKPLKSTLNNMEVIFTVAVAIACAASYVSFMQPQPAKAGDVARAHAIPVVVVSAKRLTEQEKKTSLIEERQAMLANATASAL
ncbi:hypothetical protein GQ37_001160 [Janthinobacterium sp. BJB1]|uniref:hypothetical protein n=1 Tax=Janthinobacterium sp. GW458P TaxID=1981504 RepID=UPI000A325F16|nr:hypothetical protein [Janthinobacterium sp. GW458P]MBE3025669.1 hypothetical protein [Janthinobacterium sp. GW458P]PHV14026.1 hypothetical protein CSQ90_25660 [Janthinobacterium sp. BJB303]PJD00269.1 hypothetical protein GQ37_001160 [Janthinobacterium sp. BJB1]